jgi:hypothetical protein
LGDPTALKLDLANPDAKMFGLAIPTHKILAIPMHMRNGFFWFWG